SMTVEERLLRRRLRAHGRALGDRRQGDRQETTRLAHEVGYEHWHRILFARFLAENELLIEPESGQPLSLEECRELARERNEDPWGMVGRFAERILPRIFRPDDPSLAVRLPPEAQQALEQTLEGLPAAVFRAEDALGWTYQFWQTDRKDEVNRSEAKIGADELPAVTQLFTERYMVRFLFHNTVGAWRAGKVLALRRELAKAAEGEAALREVVRLGAAGGYDFDYLRFVRESSDDRNGAQHPGLWRPASGPFTEWPRQASDLKVLDPCCGSGHFLVEGLHLFTRLRMEEEDLPLEEAIRAVLRDNVHGLEIDPRCAQIAAFALALAAWKLVGRVIELPPVNVACSGLAPNTTKEEWLLLAERTAATAGSAPRKDLFERRETLQSSALRKTFGTLHDLFVRAPTLGSLIDPRAAGASVFAARFDSVRPLVESVLHESEGSPDARERAVAAAGMVRAASLLATTYSLVVTNYPYLARKGQDETLRGFADENHKAAKGDLATMFLQRAFGWSGDCGTQAVVVPQNWRFLKTYLALREDLLTRRRVRFVALLGPGAFETIGGHMVNVSLTILSTERGSDDWHLAGLDVSVPGAQTLGRAPEKARLLATTEIRTLSQRDQLRNPEARITLADQHGTALLSLFAEGHQGIATADYSCFGRNFWEFPQISRPWIAQQSTVEESTDFGGREHVLNWGDEGETYEAQHARVRIQGGGIWNRQGIVVSQMGPLPATRYTGEKFDNNSAALGPIDDARLPAVWCFVSSPDYARKVRELDQQLKVTNATLVQVPFDLQHWQGVAAQRYPNGLPEPYSDDPTQWIFHGHPCASVGWDPAAKLTAEGPLRTDATVLQVAVARLLAYRWPAEGDPRLRLAREARALVERCASLEHLADADGIVCVPAVRGEASAADRLRPRRGATSGDTGPGHIDRRLLAPATPGPRPAVTLDEWLRSHFFEGHCRLFHQRPFVWHIWDGLPDGFAALVNYHRLAGPDGEGRRTLESLTHSYLGDWIERQRAGQRQETSGADARLAAALELKPQLEAILAGAPPLDLFIRWKPLHEQPIGWEPDINDGVRLNIRPFLRAELRRGGRKGAGILRAKPNIKWTKDRGKESQHLNPKRKGDDPEEYRPKTDYPWFWSCPGEGTQRDRIDFPGGPAFDGARWNDLHYTTAT
ncbi:MAG: hypothetical protein OXC11_09425, partial [Rhodospirillales bacterium]|nr:hypothetical protein [Rhodospirillales bacterium]